MLEKLPHAPLLLAKGGAVNELGVAPPTGTKPLANPFSALVRLLQGLGLPVL